MMLIYEQVRPGDHLPKLVKGPVTRQMLVEWCAAENDYYPLHYDERTALAMNLPGTPIQGTYKYALMGQMIQNWLGGSGRLIRISATYRGISLEGETLTACGRVKNCTSEGQEGRVELEIWIENGAGERSTTGQAAVLLSRTSIA